jgi:hypothetical protein
MTKYPPELPPELRGVRLANTYRAWNTLMEYRGSYRARNEPVKGRV